MSIWILFIGSLMAVAVVYAARRVRYRQPEEVHISFALAEEARRWLATAKVTEGEQQVQITIKRVSPSAEKRLARTDDDL